MDLFEALILGVVQGVTEFLPVSSSGHLVLLQKIMGISEPTLFFDTMVHVGTLAAVFAVLWKDIWNILRRLFQPLTGFLILATIPTVIIALVFKNRVEEAFSSGAYLGFAFLVTSVSLLSAEHLARRRYGELRSELRMNWLDSLVIGICQGIAIIPGVSRSGMTLSGAIARKLDRGYAARFSFLLSIPAILGALILQLRDLTNSGGLEESGIGLLPILVGTLSAGLVGFFSVRFMIKTVKERSLRGFAAYTAILGGLVLLDQYVIHRFF